MAKQYKVYLDVCCFNRPFDDQTQERVRLETEAILLILSRCRSGSWKLVSSNALDVEIGQTPNLERMNQVQGLLAIAKIKVQTSESLEERTRALAQLGLTFYDAAHVASAERSKSDILLTTDDRLVRKASQLANQLSVKVENPVTWLASITWEEKNDENPE